MVGTYGQTYGNIKSALVTRLIRIYYLFADFGITASNLARRHEPEQARLPDPDQIFCILVQDRSVFRNQIRGDG